MRDVTAKIENRKWDQVYIYYIIGFVFYDVKIRKTIFWAMKVNMFFNKFNSPKLGQLETEWPENLTLSTVWDADANAQETQSK